MEELTKQQIILLTLLISFVTSIATGIVTVSLMEQTPGGVTQTINQVIERTVERVVPAENQNASAIKETVIVSNEDQTILAVDKGQKSLVKIREAGPAASSTIALGILTSSDGSFLTDTSVFTLGVGYSGRLPTGEEYPVIFATTTSGLKVKLGIPSDIKKKIFPAVLATNDVRLGQSIIVFGGNEGGQVALGIVQGVASSSATSTNALKSIRSIKTSVDTASLLPGSPVINLSGQVVGIKTLSLSSDVHNEFGAIRDVALDMI